MANTFSFPDLLTQIKIIFDPHFFATKQLQMFPNQNHLLIYSLFFFINELAKLVTKGKCLVTKVEVSVTLATVLVAILSPATKNFGFYSK